MAIIKRTAIVPYTPEQMYRLVEDIPSYPAFVPWCSSVEVLNRSAEEVRARIDFKRAGLSHGFSTINRLHPNTMIEMHLLEGPFRHLEGYWRFEDLKDQGSKISFDLEFLMQNRFIDKLAGHFLEEIAETFVEAFCKRAETLYGSNKNR